MVDLNIVGIDELRKNIEGAYNAIGTDENIILEGQYDGVYMFFSFDLVNSTQFKVLNKDKWKQLLTQFYDFACSKMLEIKGKSDDYNIKIWKYIGDEVLFYKKISDKRELYYNVEKAYNIQQDIYSYLCENFKEEVKPNMHVKTCIWIARCSDNIKVCNNIIHTIDKTIKVSSNTLSNIDFLGPDIDKGFRLSNFTSKGQVAVSSKLVCLIYKIISEYEKNHVFTYKEVEEVKRFFKIVSYQKLKGVWGERFYPIIWYHQKWSEKEDMFEYDEYFTSEIISSYYDNVNKNNSKFYKLDILFKVYKDLNKICEIEDIIEYIGTKEKEDIESVCKSKRIKKSRSKIVSTEVHCVAICFNKDNKVLVLKRADERERLPGHWEFGCGKLNNNESWKECILKEYKSDLGIDLSVEDNPIPIATYMLNMEECNLPGIIFLAKFEGEEEDIIINRDKFSGYKWLDIKDAEDFLSREKTVDSMIQNIKKAYKIIA